MMAASSSFLALAFFVTIGCVGKYLFAQRNINAMPALLLLLSLIPPPAYDKADDHAKQNPDHH